MMVKIDTKEKFHVITLLETNLAANMTAELSERLLPYMQNVVKNVVLSMEKVTIMDETIADELVNIQQQFYDNGASFVICALQPEVEKFLLDTDKLEVMNVTPTESEAWDIVQMEEIERELEEEEYGEKCDDVRNEEIQTVFLVPAMVFHGIIVASQSVHRLCYYWALGFLCKFLYYLILSLHGQRD